MHVTLKIMLSYTIEDTIMLLFKFARRTSNELQSMVNACYHFERVLSPIKVVFQAFLEWLLLALLPFEIQFMD